MSTHDKFEHTNETTIDRAGDMVEGATDGVKDVVSATGDVVKEGAKRVASQVGEQAKTTVESRKSDVAQELGAVADVVRQTSYEAGIGTSPTVMDYGQRIANQIEGVSSYLDENGVEQILGDVQSFARRQPAVFLGGAFMFGLMAGRFLRSSAGPELASGTSGYDDYQAAGYRDTTSGNGGRDAYEDMSYDRQTDYPSGQAPDGMASQE